MTLIRRHWPATSISWNYKAPCWLAMLLLIVTFQHTGWAQQGVDKNAGVIGEVVLVKGGVTASSETRIDRDLIAGAPVYRGDVIETDRLSFVAIRFIDGGKLTLQPSSKIDLQEFNNKNAQENQTFELLKGGLRAITGAIGKRRPERVTYYGQGITVGIRGTAFAMRLCTPGAPRCKFDRGINFQGRIVTNRPE
ncbi:MAG: FecR domain-containing protein, partial [Arenicella sp.]|nr:FecR domain-containing protein [Arenicella sp.]